MGISPSQLLSLSALSVRLSLGFSLLFKLFGLYWCLLDLKLSFLACFYYKLFDALLLPLLSKTGISSLSPGLIVVFLSSCALSRISEKKNAYDFVLLQQDPRF